MECCDSFLLLASSDFMLLFTGENEIIKGVDMLATVWMDMGIYSMGHISFLEICGPLSFADFSPLVKPLFIVKNLTAATFQTRNLKEQAYNNSLASLEIKKSLDNGLLFLSLLSILNI